MINILIPQEGRTGALENNLLGVMGKDNFAKSIGAIIKEARPGYAVAEIQISDMHKNGLGIVQGGVIYARGFTFAAASYASGRCTIGVQSSITYFKPPKVRYCARWRARFHPQGGFVTTASMCTMSSERMSQDERDGVYKGIVCRTEITRSTAEALFLCSSRALCKRKAKRGRTVFLGLIL